jgi:SAM-dependent methyltransferase
MRKQALLWFYHTYNWLAERLYHELAGIYDPISWLVSLGHWSRWRNSVLDYIHGPRVLEVGFGTGELQHALAQRGLAVYGLDFSPAMQRVARGKLRRRGDRTDRVRGSALQMPFGDDTMDTILATFPANYIMALETWQEVCRVLHHPTDGDGAPGRFVIGGIYLKPRKSTLVPVALISSGARWQDIQGIFQNLAQRAGMSLQVVMRQEGDFDLPVLIATPNLK